MQTCNKCKVEKSLDKFEWQKGRPNPRKTCHKCRELSRDSHKRKLSRVKWRNLKVEKDPRYLKRSSERALYGVCKEDFGYQECWICRSKDNLCIDHCHNSNKVRGLLCRGCNFALGHFGDSLESLERAIVYLKKQPHFELG